MKILLLLLLLLLPLITNANPIDDNCRSLVYDGAPTSNIENAIYLCRTNYAVKYRYDVKGAEYVVEHLTASMLNGIAKRQNNFRIDSDIPDQYQSKLSDYAGTNYDRGHLSNAEDNVINDNTMSESFLLSNMIPQNPDNNRGEWKKLETVVRNWARDKGELFVITGTIYNSNPSTIGSDTVAVPIQLYKVIINPKNNKMIGFLMPNQPIHDDLHKYMIEVGKIEQLTSITFFPNLENNSLKTIDLSEWVF